MLTELDPYPVSADDMTMYIKHRCAFAELLPGIQFEFEGHLYVKASATQAYAKDNGKQPMFYPFLSEEIVNPVSQGWIVMARRNFERLCLGPFASQTRLDTVRAELESQGYATDALELGYKKLR